MEIFLNVLIVTFKHFNASLMTKSKNEITVPKRLNTSVSQFIYLCMHCPIKMEIYGIF